MKKIILLLCCIVVAGFSLTANARQRAVLPDGIFYVVRHAEKDTGRNPVLTEAGKKRAGDLYRRLENSNITQIYSTNYARTKMTGDSLRLYQKIDTIHYAADTTGEGLSRQLQNNFKKNTSVLIIGHSNTVPAIIRKLGVVDYFVKELDEKQFDCLFIITIKAGHVSLQREVYGEKSKLNL